VDDDEIRSLLTGLGGADSSGGTVIERAAMLAEGADFVAWTTARGGRAEAQMREASSFGLSMAGRRRTAYAIALGASPGAVG
jgi:hypothetical protein